MLLLGIDLGTSSIKVTVLDAASQRCLATAQYPDAETDIIVPSPGWAEQDPNLWWENICQAVRRCNASGSYDPRDIGAIGIAYQMHGLVLVDETGTVLRNSIIWCDSRAVDTGSKAFDSIGHEKCLSTLLNSPGNFTAAKLGWVKANEPDVYNKIKHVLLPGDFVSLRLTGEYNTTASALSEGILWDFKKNELSKDVLGYFSFDPAFFPTVNPLFSRHGDLLPAIASSLGLKPGIPVAYKAGDQPNNALSLNVLKPGEVAATAGTSGVIYGVSDELHYDKASRINSFAHVNHTKLKQRIGILLCINGVGIFNRWLKTISGNIDYARLNQLAANVAEPRIRGADGLLAIPFGNGAERMLNNEQVGGQFLGLDFNIHGLGHLVRAVQEGIAYSFRYGLDIMRENGIQPRVIRAAKANLFLSPVFAQAFADINDVAIEFYEGDGSFGAALGAGIGAGAFADANEAAKSRKPVGTVEPIKKDIHQQQYVAWKNALEGRLHAH